MQNNTIPTFKKTVTAHMVVKNEDQWIWYAIMSVIDWVDKMLIFDTGSRDKTVAIIQTFLDNPAYKDKIIFEELGAVTPQEFPKIRQRQLDMTNTDYLLLVDGDEVWWKDGIIEFRKKIDEFTPPRVCIRFICPCEDLYHYRDFHSEMYTDEKVGVYHGSVSSRGISMKIPGLRCCGDYGVEGYRGDDGRDNLRNYDAVLLNNYYFHCSKLRRSSAVLGDESIPYRRRKISDTWDHEFPADYKYPEVFYMDHPAIVPDAFKSKDNFSKRITKIMAKIYRKLKRSLKGNK